MYVGNEMFVCCLFVCSSARSFVCLYFELSCAKIVVLSNDQTVMGYRGERLW